MAIARRIPTCSDDAYRAINGLSEKQRDVMGAIAINQDGGGHHPATLASLVKRGLIEEHEVTERWNIGMFTYKRYTMPLFVHIAWCQWCSDTLTDEVADA